MLGIPDGGPDYSSLNQQVEELTAECMINAGWEYIPVQYPDQPLPGNPFEDIQVIKRVGLGAVSQLLSEDGSPLGVADPWEGFVDPNDAYVATLSENEKAAYDVSRYGTAEEQKEDRVTITTFDPKTGNQWGMVGPSSGCAGEAYAEASVSARTQTSEDADAIRGYWDELRTRVKADPRTIALDERWVACMKDSGYDYDSPLMFGSDATAQFQAKAQAIAGADAYSHPTDGWSPDQLDEYIATHTEEEVDALFTRQTEFTADQRTGLEALMTQEIAVAVADFECSASFKDEAAQIYADVEEEYALVHKDELAALAATMAGRK